MGRARNTTAAVAAPARGAKGGHAGEQPPRLTPAAAYERFRDAHLNVTYADTDAAVRAAVKELDRIAPESFALDFETASTNARWGPLNGSLSLIQVGVRDPDHGPRQFLLDCHRADPAPLAPLMADADVETLIHYSDFELLWAKTQMGVDINGVYDTCIAWQVIQKKLKALPTEEAQALLAGWEKHNAKLSTLVERYVHMQLPKESQSSDWSRRPLSANQIVYAALDAAILGPLADVTKRVASEVGVVDDIQGRLSWVRGKVLDRAAQTGISYKDDSRRVRWAMERAVSADELERVRLAARQVPVAPENARALADVYEQRRAQLAAA